MALGPFKYNDLAIYTITIITITIIKRDLTGFFLSIQFKMLKQSIEKIYSYVKKYLLINKTVKLRF